MPTSSRFAIISTPSAEGELRCGTLSGKFLRLIPSRFPPKDLYARIAGGRDAEWAELEAETNPRLRAQERLLGSRIEGQPPPRFQNWNHAPFAYGARYGSRFWGSDVPVMELMSDIRTALAVSVAKREEFMRMTEEGPMEMDMRVLSHPIKGVFADARDLAPDASEQERRDVGRQVLGLGADGLRFRPRERPAGEGVAVLSTRPLDSSGQAAHFRFLWDGSRVAEIYSFDTGELFALDRLEDPELKLVR